MDAKKLELAFLLTAGPDASTYAGGYWHARCNLVTVHEDGTPRNITGYAFEGTLGLEYLSVSAQCDDTATASYGWHAEYRDAYSIDTARAAAMAATLRRIDARMDKMRDTLGYPATFGAFLARVASILGARFIVRTRDGGDGWYSSGEYRILDAPAAMDWLAQSERDYIAQHAGARETATA